MRFALVTAIGTMRPASMKGCAAPGAQKRELDRAARQVAGDAARAPIGYVQDRQARLSRHQFPREMQHRADIRGAVAVLAWVCFTIATN